MYKTLWRKSVMIGARATGMSAASARLFGGLGAIFMLHRIGPPQNASGLNAFLSCEPGFLDELFDTLKTEGWRFVTLDEVADRLRAGHRDERFAALTLDDGYRDNAERGAPVFAAHEVPYTVFICPGLIDGSTYLWWEIAARIIEEHDTVRFRAQDGEIELLCATAAQKQAAYDRLTGYLTCDVDEDTQRVLMARFAGDYDVDVDVDAHRRASIMDWDGLRTLAADPLCTIGAHTNHHFSLRRLDRERAMEEIAGSVRRIGAELGETPRHFAFPYGGPTAAGAREVEMVREAGLTTAVTTRHGLLQPGHADHLHALPRISLNGEYQQPHYVETMLSGLTVALANRGRKLVTI